MKNNGYVVREEARIWNYYNLWWLYITSYSQECKLSFSSRFYLEMTDKSDKFWEFVLFSILKTDIRDDFLFAYFLKEFCKKICFRKYKIFLLGLRIFQKIFWTFNFMYFYTYFKCYKKIKQPSHSHSSPFVRWRWEKFGRHFVFEQSSSTNFFK